MRILRAPPRNEQGPAAAAVLAYCLVFVCVHKRVKASFILSSRRLSEEIRNKDKRKRDESL
jgi:hypothetical protein